MIKISISFLLCLCITPTQYGFVFLPQPIKPSLRIYYILFWCVHFLKKITKKTTTVVIYPVFSKSPSLALSLCVCGSVWLPLCLLVGAYIHRDRERCSDSMREVHGCVMKPIITGWETGIVHAIDKSLSVMSAVFCQRPVFLSSFFFLLEGRAPSAATAWKHKGITLLDRVCLAIMHDLHLILGYDRLPYTTVEHQA